MKARQSRAKADEATEKADRDYRIYVNLRRVSRVYQEYMKEDLQAAESKKLAKEAVLQAKQNEEEATQAVRVMEEIQAAVRRAEEAAIFLGIK